MKTTTILALFRLFLELVVFFARRVEKAEIEKAILDDLLAEHRKRADAAAAAADDVRSGRVQPDASDPNRRD
jgi:hypothetical protein